MKAKKIYLIRHGQTDFNLNGIVQGSGVDADLNATGWHQALCFYEKYKEVPFKKIYISSLKRTYQSVSKFIEAGIAFEKDTALNEISWGELDGKLSTADLNNVYWQIVGRWKKGDLMAKVKGAETPLDVESRLSGFVNRILNEEEYPVLVCVHGRAMRILLSMLTRTSLEFMDSFPHHNLCLYLLEVKDGQVKIILQNDLSHLQLKPVDENFGRIDV